MGSAATTTYRPNRPTTPVFEALAIVGLLGIAVVHLLDLGEKMDAAPYLGAAYIGLIAGCAVAAVFLLRHDQRGFVVAGRLAAATFIAYNFSRTIGFPGTTDDINNWLEPLGVWALAAEGAVVGICATALTVARSNARRRTANTAAA